MATSRPLRVAAHSHFHRVDTFAEKLGGNTFAFLAKNVLLFRNKKGKYVVLTINPKAQYSAEDYLQLPEGAPYELLNGKLTLMPSPKNLHQEVSMNLSTELHFYVKKNKLGTVRAAPFDVHFDDKNIAQPDILFLSNHRKDRLKDWVYGAPDFMVEIISKSSVSNDRKTKFNLYEKHGVLEYWLVDLDARSVEVFVAEGGKFIKKGIFSGENQVISEVVKGFEISVNNIFENAESH